jgi:hypothetical protein
MHKIPHKLDLSRLDHLERIGTRASGASRDTIDRRNDIIGRRQEALREQDKILKEIGARWPRARHDLDLLKSSDDGRAYLAKAREIERRLVELDEALELATAHQEEQIERRDAAGSLFEACRRWAVEHGLIERERNIR